MTAAVAAPATMRAAVLLAPGELAVRRVPRPTAPAPHEVVAEVHYTGICRTDLHLSARAAHAPVVLGHEVVCRIPGEDGYHALNNELSCGGCDPCRDGETSHCVHLVELGVHRDGGFAQWIRAPRAQLQPLALRNPVLGVFTEPLSCALRAERRLRRLRPRAPSRPWSALVIGGGVSGALVARLLSRWPDRPRIRLLDPVPAELPWLDGTDGTDGLGALGPPDGPGGPGVRRVAAPEGPSQLVVECTGTPEGTATAFDAVAPTGTVCLYGVPEPDVPLPRTPDELFRAEVTVLPSVAGATPATMRAAADLIRRDEAFFTRLLGRRVPLERLPAELADWRPRPGTRTVVEPGR
ncbi:alcohol dehydrogenase catalytic domain-containing protein [Streptomyces sp. JNUCC 64]